MDTIRLIFVGIILMAAVGGCAVTGVLAIGLFQTATHEIVERSAP